MRYLLLGILLALSSYGIAQVPFKAQASNLAIPPAVTADKEVPGDLISLVIVDSCKLVVSIVGVDSKGDVYPLHYDDTDKDNVQKLLLDLESKISADKVLEITLPCKESKLSGLPNT